MDRNRLQELFGSIAVLAAKAQAAVERGDDSAEIGEFVDDITGDIEKISTELWGMK